MNMIIGKRQIILAALVVGLGIAVYLNWEYSSANQGYPVSGEAAEAANYGEAQYVNGQSILPESFTEIETENMGDGINYDEANNDSFFVEAKMSRQRARDEAVETLSAMLEDVDLAAEQKAELAMRAADLADSIEIEGKIENLIKAKGFSDVMVYYDTARADVMIKTPGLLSDEVMQIRDIILKETEILAENISIIEVN